MTNHSPLPLKSCICEIMLKLLEEQEGFKCEKQFIIPGNKKDVIPFILYTKHGGVFRGKGMNGADDWLISPFFTIEKLNMNDCCVTLSMLEPVDIDGCRVDSIAYVYSLLRTNICLTVDLHLFCAIQPNSPKLVERPLPIIEPK